MAVMKSATAMIFLGINAVVNALILVELTPQMKIAGAGGYHQCQ